MLISEAFKSIVLSKAITKFEYNARIGRIVLNNSLPAYVVKELVDIAMRDFGFPNPLEASQAVQEANSQATEIEAADAASLDFRDINPGDQLIVADEKGYALAFLCAEQLRWVCVSDSGHTLRAGDIVAPLQTSMHKGEKLYAQATRNGAQYPDASQYLRIEKIAGIKVMANTANRLIEYGAADPRCAPVAPASLCAYADGANILGSAFEEAQLTSNPHAMFVINLAEKTYELNPAWDRVKAAANDVMRQEALAQLCKICENYDDTPVNLMRVKSAEPGEITVAQGPAGLLLRIGQKCEITCE